MRGLWGTTRTAGVPRRRRQHGVVARLVVGNEWVDPQFAKLVHGLGRVVACVGGHLPRHGSEVVDGLPQHGHGLLFVRALGGGPAVHKHMGSAVHHRLAVVRLLKVLSARHGHDAGLGISEVALGLVRRVSLLRGGLCLRFHGGHGLLDLLQPVLPERRLHHPLIAALGGTVAPVFRRNHLCRLSYVRPFLTHASLTHGMMLGGVGLQLGAVLGHMPQLDQPGLLPQPQHLHKQVAQGSQMLLAKGGQRAKVRHLVGGQHPEAVVLLEMPGQAAGGGDAPTAVP